MDYKKLITSRLSNIPHRSTDTTGAVVALLTGLAVGAVLGVLFAPESGKKTRERISDKALNLTDDLKDSYHTLKDRVSTGKEDLVGLKDRVVDNVKSKANSVTQEFKDFKDAELERAKSAVKDAADDANDSVQSI
ncbi:YtxH domain-containing protein [Pedobacter sp. MC2016-24]|uniref:YtxH domain-containing protein n=1 Tax=Pedobacter sp. MC2016-24 TaxID=2780090 RepID=UPI00187FAB9B|nr:YtxH domain-containing protein [Pedobacter sp. MC2016-24]MBE9598315.1 YtxH domain-containing protein [Pedobacter sp. MC2016-24]